MKKFILSFVVLSMLSISAFAGANVTGRADRVAPAYRFAPGFALNFPINNLQFPVIGYRVEGANLIFQLKDLVGNKFEIFVPLVNFLGDKFVPNVTYVINNNVLGYIKTDNVK